MTDKATLSITVDAHERIMACVRACATEINGIGRISYKQGKLVIDEVAVLKQSVSATHAELDTEDLMNFLATRPDASQWRVQWHSHVNMATFWSGIDEEAIKSIGETADYLISLVFNKSGEYKARVDHFKPFHSTQDDLALEIQVQRPDHSAWAKEVIADKVTTHTFAAKTKNYFGRDDGERFRDEEWDGYEENKKAPKTKEGQILTGHLWQGKVLVSDLWSMWCEIAKLADKTLSDFLATGITTDEMVDLYAQQIDIPYIEDEVRSRFQK